MFRTKNIQHFGGKENEEVTLEIKTVEAAKADMSLEQQAKIDEVLTVVNSGNTSAIVEMQKTLIEEVAKEEVSTIGYSKLVDVALPVGQTIPAGSKFSARAIFSGDAYSAVATAVANAKGAVDFVAYDFNLTDAAGNAITKFSGHADVSMPVPAGLDVAESASSAASTPVSSSVASPKTAENNMVLYVTMLAIVALGSAVYTTRKVK